MNFEISSNIDIYFLLVPNAPPTLNAFTNVGTTNFTINWSPPPPQSQNGVITSYVIDITGDPFPYIGPALILTTDGSYPDVAAKSLEVTGLENDNEYTIRIAAVNSEGTGPYTTVDTQRTYQDSKFIESINIHCFDYID